MYDFIASLPPPDPEETRERLSFVQSVNGAIVKAQLAGDMELAKRASDRAQAYAVENPYIFHSAACIYALQGDIATALRLVRGAFEHHYDLLDSMIADSDLASLHDSPAWTALLADYAERSAKVEPVVDADDDSFAAAVLQSERPVLVDFSATWCGPCQRQAPILDRLAQRAQGRFAIVKIDIDESPNTAETYDATSVPTLVVFKGSAEVARAVGLTELDALLELVAQE